jgi:hypothetical protein
MEGRARSYLEKARLLAGVNISLQQLMGDF